MGSERVFVSALLLLLVTVPVGADDWPFGECATGTWNGARTELENRGLHLEANYTGEVFTRDDDAAAYHGNLDLLLGIDTEKAKLWKGGSVLVYGQNGHGGGVSDDLGFAMPVSNYEAPDFTQLSELWLYQELPYGFRVRLGKQDANRDFASPRFGGNFANSSFGVLPDAPIPSYPAPALGAAAFLETTRWLSFRGGVYEGDSRVESVGGHAFDADSGAIVIGAANVDVEELGGRDTLLQVGAWRHTGLDRTGGFGILDFFLPFDPGRHRAVQAFLRANGEPEATAPDPTVYLGGGVTAHGFLGDDATVGLGFGWVRITDASQGFVEAFYKWRPLAWFSIEPDLQLYVLGGNVHVVTGLRCKVKL